MAILNDGNFEFIFSICRQRKEYVSRYLPWALKNGKEIKPLMPVFWEERWEQDIRDLRKELNITILNL